MIVIYNLASGAKINCFHCFKNLKLMFQNGCVLIFPSIPFPQATLENIQPLNKATFLVSAFTNVNLPTEVWSK